MTTNLNLIRGVLGFQGTLNSYSDTAAQKLEEEFGLEVIERVPLENSNNVKNALLDKRIDYGVVALQNTVGGIVKETNEIFLANRWNILHKYILEIRHCVFLKSPGIDINRIAGVASHEQALKQCQSTINRLFGEVKRIEAPDTAITAIHLANGYYTEDIAIICSKEAGLNAGLHLIHENAQDFRGNRTEFALIELKKPDLEKRNIGTFLFRWLLSSDSAFQSANKYIFLAIILIAYPAHYLSSIALPAEFQISFSRTLITLVAASLSVHTLIRRYRMRKALELITGFWIYMDKVKSGQGDDSQNYNIPRAVIVDRIQNDLRIRGWLCKEEPEFYFKDAGVFHSSPFSTNGSLIYKYTSYSNEDTHNFNGIVELEWSKPTPSSLIKRLSGRYYGYLTNSQGGLLFNRVSKVTFLKHCPIHDIVDEIETNLQ